MPPEFERMREVIVERVDSLEAKIEKLKQFRGVDWRPDVVPLLSEVEALTWVLGLFPR